MWRPEIRPLVGRLLGNDRTVLRAYRGLGMGNVWYFLLQADIRRASGADVRVSVDADQRSWADLVRGASDLLIAEAEQRFSDRRLDIDADFFQRYGVSFSDDQLARFIRDRVLSSTAWAREHARPTSSADVAINVRRGDYYDSGPNQAMYGFDVVNYVRRAVDELRATGEPAERVAVVSDDVDWCREHLGWLRSGCEGLRFVGPDDGLTESFVTVAGARRLVLTNSTFSYWAGYVHDALRAHHRPGSEEAEVWAPAFHSRAVRNGAPWQHAPHWRTLPVDGCHPSSVRDG